MTTAATEQSPYVGRFAPSPTGPLHFGSLVAALASYLDARANGGRWLLRIEDLDPPREVAGATEAIIRSLDLHGLHWDGELVYQSHRHERYQEVLNRLAGEQLVYPCYCSRKMVAAAGGVHRGRCRPSGQLRGPGTESSLDHSLRVKVTDLPAGFAERSSSLVSFEDLICGPQCQDLNELAGDFIVRRRDGLFAYQLAVVVDDLAQDISHVIRGGDLLSSTGQQIFLFSLLGAHAPRYGHIPIAVDHRGQKLSKQQGAPAIDDSHAVDNLCRALRFLGQSAPPGGEGLACGDILAWATAHWDRTRIPRQAQLAPGID